MECGRFDSLCDRPFDCAIENGRIILVHAKHETTVEHHSVAVQPAHRRTVIVAEVLEFSLLFSSVSIL